MRNARGFAAGVVVAVLGLAGCGAVGSDSAGAPDSVEMTRGHAEPVPVDADGDSEAGTYDEAGGYAEDADGGQVPSQTAGDVAAREVVTTAEVSIVVADPAESANEVVDLTEAAGGRVDQRSVRAEQEIDASTAAGADERPAHAWLTLRIPADGLDAFLDELPEVGEVGEINQSAEDVTRTAQDLDARIGALQTSTDRLLEIMAEASDSADLIAAEDALSQRQAELESLQSQRAAISDRVAMSTVHVDLTAQRSPTIESDGFLGGLQTGWHSLISFVSGLLVTAGIVVPWLPVIAIPILVIVWVMRRRRRRRSEPGTPPAAAPLTAAAPSTSTPPTSTPPTAPAQPTPPAEPTSGPDTSDRG